MRKLVVLFLLAHLGVQAQEFLEDVRLSGPRVFLFAEDFYSRAQIKVKRGSYLLQAYNKDSTYTKAYGPDDVHPLYTFRAELMFNRAECDSITITSQDTIVIRVLRGNKWTEERPYIGKLILRNNLIYLDAIARTSMEDYLAGVVEAEGGLAGRGSYLQAQAVLARTWLMTNEKKHIEDGYHVKDDQSSQAFKGVAHGGHAKEVMEAVLSVQDTVALYKGKPIIGFYHSNSGGQTALPNEVWSQSLPYCRKVVDPFSLKGSKLNWTQTHSWEQWTGYWNVEGVNWTRAQWQEFFNGLGSDRKSHWTIGEKSYKLETVRRAFKWRSTFVQGEITEEGVHITGRGFGHGVGMAQQGAMHMAASGFTWKEILDFYFKDLEYDLVENR